MDEARLQQAYDWLIGRDTGISSTAIWQMMVRGKVADRFGGTAPLDSGDFGRCYRLLLLFPEWRERIGEMATVPGWAPYVAQWDRLTELYATGGTSPRKDCYAAMMEIRKAADEARKGQSRNGNV